MLIQLLVLAFGATVYAGPHIAERKSFTAEPNQFPFMVRFDRIDEQVNWDNGTFHHALPNEQFCGAFLVPVPGNNEESDIVLTAARCLCQKYVYLYDADGFIKPPMEVVAYRNAYVEKKTRKLVAGTIQREGDAGAETRGIAEMEYHPGWNPEKAWDTSNPASPNDVAVVKLDKPLKFSPSIRAIRLPQSGENPPIPKGGSDFLPTENSTCSIAGWGFVSSTQLPKELKYMKVYAHELHEQYAVKAGLRKPTACDGDQGGPMFCEKDGELVAFGIHSKTASCVDPHVSFFNRIPMHLKWINEKIENLSAVIKKP